MIPALGEAACTHLTALEHIPCAGARCVSSPCLALPRGPEGPSPQPLQSLISADGECECHLAGAPVAFCNQDSCLPGIRDSQRGLTQRHLIMSQLCLAAHNFIQPPLSEEPCIFITFPLSHLVSQPDLFKKDWLKKLEQSLNRRPCVSCLSPEQIFMSKL